MHRIRRVASLVGFVTCPGLALAQPPPTPSSSTQIAASLSVERKQVPLPPGDWITVGSIAEASGLVSVALLQLHGRDVAGAVLIQVNRLGTALHWGVAPACSRTDLPFAKVRYQSDHDGSCAYVAVVDDAAPDRAVDPAWLEVRRRAEANGWTLPEHWGEAAFRITTPRESLQVHYAFSFDEQPAGAFPPATATLTTWAQGVWDEVERGLHNQLDPSRPLPAMPEAEPDRPDANSRDGAGAAVTMPRAVWKTITFRVVSTTIDFATNLIVIGDVLTATALTSAAAVIGPPIYLVHELAWNYYGGTTAPHVQLAGIGGEPH